MIIGTIRHDAQPMVTGTVRLHRLQIETEVHFLIDTGAAESMIHPGDADFLGIDYSNLKCPRLVSGIGGDATAFQEHAHLLFRDAATSEWYDYRILLLITEPSSHNTDYPSLLGRNILRQWTTLYDPTNDVVAFQVVSATASP